MEQLKREDYDEIETTKQLKKEDYEEIEATKQLNKEDYEEILATSWQYMRKTQSRSENKRRVA